MGGVLYSTTFPCHNCAKHIVGAGLREVYYVEPYAKSLAAQLHVDAVKLVDDDTRTENKVAFRPFIGIGARRFLDLFSVSLSFGDPIEKKDENGVLVVPYARSKNPLRFYCLASTTDAVEALCAEAVKPKQTPEATK